MPFSGAPEACAARRMNSKCMCVTASAQCSTWVRVSGWNIIAASTSWKMPALISRILPPPPSSAGVPMTSTLPCKRSSASASAIPAPAEAVAVRLWPPPWAPPRSGSCSSRQATVQPAALPPVARPDPAGGQREEETGAITTPQGADAGPDYRCPGPDGHAAAGGGELQRPGPTGYGAGRSTVLPGQRHRGRAGLRNGARADGVDDERLEHGGRQDHRRDPLALSRGLGLRDSGTSRSAHPHPEQPDGEDPPGLRGLYSAGGQLSARLIVSVAALGGSNPVGPAIFTVCC